MERLLSHRWRRAENGGLARASTTSWEERATGRRSLGTELAVGSGDFGEEGAEFGGIFFAGVGLDAAGDVYRIGSNGEDGLRDVVGSKAAGENDSVFGAGTFCDVPVGELAGAAEVFR